MATKTFTAYNSAQISTAQKKFGNSSGLFDGNDDYIITPDNADFEFGSGIDFTVEFFYYPTNTASNGGVYKVLPFDTNGWLLGTSGGTGGNAGAYSLYGANPSWTQAGAFATNVSLNNWHHIAFVRTGTTIYGYIDGTRYTLGGDYNFPNGAPSLQIGSGGSVFGRAYAYIDEVRISKGTARYTAATITVPTSAFTTDAYTVLLCHMEGANGSTTFLDDSSPAAGPANLKTYNTNAAANIKSINTNLIANVKTLDTNA